MSHPGRAILILMSLLVLLLPPTGCGDEEEPLDETAEEVGERAPGENEVQPPIPYTVGQTRKTPGVERGVAVDIVVEPGVYADELEELFTWFEDVWYSDRTLIQVDVYDTEAAAAALNYDAERVLATFRYTAPDHREVEIYERRLVAGQRTNPREEFRSGTHSVYLGPKSRMFSSQQQAQYLRKMMEDQPNKQVYEVSWLSNASKVVLTYDVTGRTLVRVREGIGREIWSEFTPERLEQAAMGGGFGGSAVHGEDYIRLDETDAQ